MKPPVEHRQRPVAASGGAGETQGRRLPVGGELHRPLGDAPFQEWHRGRACFLLQVGRPSAGGTVSRPGSGGERACRQKLWAVSVSTRSTPSPLHWSRRELAAVGSSTGKRFHVPSSVHGPLHASGRWGKLPPWRAGELAAPLGSGAAIPK